MIRKEDYAKMLKGEQDIMRMQTKDLSHADSLIQPQPGGNCMNWVMGHLVDNLMHIQKLLGGVVPEGLPNLSRYARNSEPIRADESGVVPLQELVDACGVMTEAVCARLEQMSEADFEAEVDFWEGKTRLGYVAFFYFFHHTYHIGQLEQGRNLAGKTEKLI